MELFRYFLRDDSSLQPALFFLLVFFLTYIVYAPGLTGGFLFDDFVNLEEMGTYGGVVDFSTLKSFVLTGFSGPTGRPLSLLSFLLNDNTWPSYAASFKVTNLLIHLLVGLLVAWSSLLLLRFYRFSEQHALWIAVLSSAVWLLHPYFVSTTLYVVQRMAQLATLFMLAGLVGYLWWRLRLAARPRAAYIGMTLSLGAGTVLAVLSKENGALLPMLVLVVEFCNPDRESTKLNRWWQIAILWLPSLAVLVGLARLINFSPDAWPNRPFDQPQRLLSECRIVLEYLFHLYVPQVEGRGLFQDGYVISKSFLSPISTLYSALGLLVLLGSALALRKRWPLFALAVLFFFVSHLVESTVVALELYFEHRNYAAAVFLFLPVAQGLVYLGGKVRPFVIVLIAGVVFSTLAAMTWQRANLWGNTDRLELFWAYSTPESPRAHNSIAAFLFNQGKVEEANRELENASKLLPDSALLTIRLLAQKVYQGTAAESDFAITAKQLRNQPFDAQAVKGLRLLVDKVIEPTTDASYRDLTLSVIASMSANPRYQRFPLFQRLMPYLKARVYLAQGKVDLAAEQYDQAMQLYAESGSALMMVSELALAGEQEAALKLLPQALEIYRNQPDSSLRRSRAEYDDEFARLERDLRADIAAKAAQNATSPVK